MHCTCTNTCMYCTTIKNCFIQSCIMDTQYKIISPEKVQTPSRPISPNIWRHTLEIHNVHVGTSFPVFDCNIDVTLFSIFQLVISLRPYPPSLHLEAGKEGTIYLLFGSNVQKPDSGFFSLIGRETILMAEILRYSEIFQQDFRPVQACQKTEWCR